MQTKCHRKPEVDGKKIFHEDNVFGILNQNQRKPEVDGKKIICEDNVFAILNQNHSEQISSDVIFLVINKDDVRVAERALFYERDGKDMMQLANDKRKDNELTTVKERSAYLREELHLYSRNVYVSSKHKASKGKPWLVTNVSSSHFPNDNIFNAYEKSKGTWFEMSGKNFYELNLCDDESRKAWIEKIHVKFNTWDFKFSSLNKCDIGGNVYGNLVTMKPEVIFTAIIDGLSVRHVIIHDEHGMDLRRFVLSKEKDGVFNSYSERGEFQRDVLNIQAMSVYDPTNKYHEKWGKDREWYVTSFDASNFHIESLFESYKKSKGEWFEMNGNSFLKNKLSDTQARQVWLNKFSEKYEDWNIKFKMYKCS